MRVNRTSYTTIDRVVKRDKKAIKHLTGNGEEEFIVYLEEFGFKKDKDFFHQFVEEKYILDIAFPEQKICVEIDGINHRNKRNKIKDKERDIFLSEKGWFVVRVPVKNKTVEASTAIVYLHLIKTIIENRV